MKKFVIPILTIVALGIGLSLGTLLAKRSNSLGVNTIGMKQPASGDSKIDQFMHFIDATYVDTLDMDELSEEVIMTLLSELDPHSSYIPAEDLEAVNSELEGSFNGIGVQFNIQEDTINIVAVISGGPSESVGLLAEVQKAHRSN